MHGLHEQYPVAPHFSFDFLRSLILKMIFPQPHSVVLAMLFSNDINRNGIDLNIFLERSLEQNLLNVLCINSPQCTKEIQFSSSKQSDKRILGLDQPCKTVRLEVKDNSSNNKIEKENEERKEIQYLGGLCN